MLDAFTARASLVLVSAMTLASCGGEGVSTPTRQYARGTQTLSGPDIAANSSFCTSFQNAKAGEVSVGVTPPSIHLALGAGSCTAPGQILAARDGEIVNVEAPEGWNHVTLTNRSDAATPFTLRIHRWY